jgi:outer membrane protein
MIKSALLALLVLASPVLAEAGRLKIGTVDMQRVFKEFHKTEAADKECKVELARLQKQDGERISRIRDIDAELEKLRKQLEDPAIAESKKAKLLGQANDRREEGIALERERRDFVTGRRRSIHARMFQKMKELLDEIREELDELAKTEDYDYIFDASGLSASQVPFVLVDRAADDLTTSLLTKLNGGTAKRKGAEPGPK